MDEIKETTEQQKVIRNILIFGGAYLLGCMVGGAKVSRASVDSYKKGVYDTLEAIILKPER